MVKSVWRKPFVISNARVARGGTSILIRNSVLHPTASKRHHNLCHVGERIARSRRSTLFEDFQNNIVLSHPLWGIFPFSSLPLSHQRLADRHSGASAEVQKEEEKKFKEVGEAFTILSDPKKKARYDSGQDLEEDGMNMGGE